MLLGGVGIRGGGLVGGVLSKGGVFFSFDFFPVDRGEKRVVLYLLDPVLRPESLLGLRL